MTVLISLAHVNVALNGVRVLHDISWELRRGENWAILGGNGAGKSTLLRLLRGEIWPAPEDGGARTYAFDGKPTRSPIGVKRRMALVSAEQQTRYLRQHEWQLTARDIVLSGAFDSEVLLHGPRTAVVRAQKKAVDDMLDLLGIGDVAGAHFRKLSQGQLRKALIGRALMGKPDVLVLDEVCVGLDVLSRRHVLDVIQRVAEAGTQVLMTTHRRDELIPAITHVMELKHGRIAEIREKTAAEQRRAPDTRTWHGIGASAMSISNGATTGPLLHIQNASVALNEGADVVLRDVNWRMNEGEHWLIAGDNGVGKSTLLRLILGELRPADGGAIHRFGMNGNTSVWEIKKRIGYVSADFQARYAADLSAEKVIATGFFASVGWLQPTSRQQDARVDELLDMFNLRALAKRSILEMSYGQARKVLIARALANSPRLLILDEVFDGLDPHFRAELTDVLESLAAPLSVGGVGGEHTSPLPSGGVGGGHTSLILVAHHEADTLPCITHRMTLAGGRIVKMEVRTPLPLREGLGVG